MTVTSSNRSGSTEEQFAEVLAEITKKIQAGESVDVEVYITQTPEHEHRLRRLVSMLQLPAVEWCAPSFAGVGTVNNDPMGDTFGDFRILREVGRGGMGWSTKPSSCHLAAGWL